MKATLVLIGLAVIAALLVNGAVARIPGENGEFRTQTPPRVMQVSKAPVKERKLEARAKQLKPLVLPNIGKLTAKMWKVDRSTLSSQLSSSKQVLRFFRNHQHRWLLAPGKDKCWQVPWQRTCTVARATVRLHASLAAVAKQRLDHEIPLINDWRTAVRWVQRIYPGTESWMLYISDREGGWGPWVWYGGRTWSGYHVGNDFLGADTVGGWMQFRYSTFAPYWRGAQKDLRQRGYLIPEIPMPSAGGPSEYAAWLSPLGQALTAGYMRYYGKDGCHWCL